MRQLISAFTVVAICLLAGASHAVPTTPFIEEMTWVEVRDAQRAGKTTLIIPVGGTEQNGPHMVLGKHNVRVQMLAGRIANALGNALVAPVVAVMVDEPGAVGVPVTGHEMLVPAATVAGGAGKQAPTVTPGGRPVTEHDALMALAEADALLVHLSVPE